VFSWPVRAVMGAPLSVAETPWLELPPTDTPTSSAVSFPETV
jgi:hypothetical protein